ncbi:MAG TPA: hypothetical protein VNR88_05530 [Hyphomicrobium sp.]|nr:hypothetical protein [Hyphomicrobium sp.]
MRLRTTAFLASALAGLLYVTMPTTSASALPSASRADVAGSATGLAEEVRYRRRGYRGWGGYHRHRHYGHRRYGYRPYYYRRPYYSGWGYPYHHRRRGGFGLYLGF